MDQASDEYHQPVMTAHVLELFAPIKGVILDATYGGGGHARALLRALPSAQVVAIDRDPEAAAQAVTGDRRFRFVRADFRELARVAAAEGLSDLNGALFDLGVSSRQLDDPARGFSFRGEGPLDMRMGPDAPHDAADIVNGWTVSDLARVLRKYGEEPFARRVAEAIVRARPLTTTLELAEVAAGAIPAAARRRRHPARRTFQALRMAVNDELAALESGLDAAVGLLAPGGRVIVLAYHSLEDRIVKRRFREGAAGCVCPPDLPVCGCGNAAELRILTRRPLRATEDEVAKNPRARSARLRAAERIAA